MVDFNWEIPFMAWVHGVCLLLFALKKCQSAMRLFGAYTKVFLAWMYTGMYIFGVLYVIYCKRYWAQIKVALDAGESNAFTEPWEDVYDCERGVGLDAE